MKRLNFHFVSSRVTGFINIGHKLFIDWTYNGNWVKIESSRWLQRLVQVVKQTVHLSCKSSKWAVHWKSCQSVVSAKVQCTFLLLDSCLLPPLVQSTQPPKNNSTQPIPKSNISSLHFELPTSFTFLHLMILCRRARARITRSWAHITSHPLLHEHGKAHITSHIVLSENRESSHHITSSCCAWKWESPFVPRAWVP